MRRSRQFRPLALAPLEDRVVLSHVSLSGHQPKPTTVVINGTPVQQTKATIEGPIVGNVGNFGGQSIAQTLAAGKPVYQEITTNFVQSGTSASTSTTGRTSTQTEFKLTVPNKADNTITTTSQINLRGGGGAEKVVDVETLNKAGQPTGHTITTTLPNGAVQTETDVVSVSGGKTYEKGTITLPGGTTETSLTVVSTGGNTTTNDVTVTDPGGRNTRTVTVVTARNELQSSAKITTTYPDSTVVTSTSNTNVLRLTPPSYVPPPGNLGS